MSPRRKPGNPMKYRGFYCPDDLWNDMRKCAEKLDISDSEYIRNAIEHFNDTVDDKKIRPDNVIIGPVNKKQPKQEFKTFFKK